MSNSIPLQVAVDANKTYDQAKEAAGGALKRAKEVRRLCDDGSWKDGIGGNKLGLQHLRISGCNSNECHPYSCKGNCLRYLWNIRLETQAMI